MILYIFNAVISSFIGKYDEIKLITRYLAQYLGHISMSNKSLRINSPICYRMIRK